MGALSGYGIAELRHKLFTIVEYEEPQHQERKIPALVSRYPAAHVRVLPNPFAVPLIEFNCVAYALDLVGRFEPRLIRVAANKARYAADTDLLVHAIEQGLLQEIPYQQQQRNDLAVYFRGPRVRHVARYVTPRNYVSKWGAGVLCEHGLWDVPKTHGEEVRFFKLPQLADVLAFLSQQVPGSRVLQ